MSYSTTPLLYSAPLCNRNVYTCPYFRYKMVHCGIFVRCILGFVRRVYLIQVLLLVWHSQSPICYHTYSNITLVRDLSKEVVGVIHTIPYWGHHYHDVIMGAMASQITSPTIVCSTLYCANQRKHQSSASLALVRGIHRWPVNSPHKWPVARKMFPYDDVIMSIHQPLSLWPTFAVCCSQEVIKVFQCSVLWVHLLVVSDLITEVLLPRLTLIERTDHQPADVRVVQVIQLRLQTCMTMEPRCHNMKRFSDFWPFVKGIHRSQVDFPLHRFSIAEFWIFWQWVYRKLSTKQLSGQQVMKNSSNDAVSLGSKCSRNAWC